MEKINTICLIDDDMIFRYLTQTLITKTQLVKDIDAFSNGLDAINFLKAVSINQGELPDIILLDLFMPVMDGWGFLKEYEKLQPKLTKKIPIYIVTSSIDPADIQKSKAINLVIDFIVKPMTKESFLYIMSKHTSTNPLQ